MSTNDSQNAQLEGLDELYCHLMRSADTDDRDTWRHFAANQGYRRELRRAAARLLRARHLPRDRANDVVHDALLLLANCLRRNRNLGFKPEYGRERFVAWLRAVALSHCQWALRRQTTRGRKPDELCEDWAATLEPNVIWRAELSDALESLDERERAVVAAYRQLGSIEAVSECVGLSTTTAWRRFRAAVRILRRRCEPFVASGHIAGLSTVRKKW